MSLSLPEPGPPLPSLSALLGGALPGLLADCRRHVGQIAGIERAVGGNVSHVFRVRGACGNVILKIRADRFARIPALRTDPAMIADERRALEVYAGVEPSVFPRVLAFRAAAHAMILTDVFPDGRNYHQHLDQRPATAEEMTRLGSTLRRIHQATQDVRTEIRSQGDVWFRDHTFGFCLRATGHDALSRACEELAALPGQQLILGDLAPKNLSLAGGVAICDLDNVHRGWPLYDIGYFLAHLLIHHLRWAGHLRTLVPALLAAYFAAEPPQQRSPADAVLMAKVVAGVVLYRLATETVPYPLAGPPALASRFRDRVLRLLDTGAFTVQDLIRAAKAPERADA
ncbi:phosphotransferase [Sphaerisporangium sp. NPDC051017]|uniref:phosphotransferase n=1 Tax=Sphaerisporangium sp. NPDC051017 TaxID=3154636 RepID=UPI00341F6481